MGLWFLTVEKKLPKYGNYLRTVPLNSVYKNWRSYNPFCRIIGCHKKLPFPDGIRYANWTSFDIPNHEGYKEFKYAGDIRSVPEVYERIKDMKDVFDGEIYVSVSNSRDMLSGYYSKNTLYQASVIRAAILCRFPVIYTDSYADQRLLMYPSDIGKLSPLLEYTPDDLVRWAYQKGLLDITEMQIMLENEDFPLPHVYRPADICDGFAYECAEIEFLNREDQDEEWIDVIR